MRFDAAIVSAKGGHDVNEDSVFCENNEGGLTAVLADGLGGHGGGDIASKLAVEHIGTLSSAAREDVNAAFNAANGAILAAQNEVAMKSTAVALIIENQNAVFAHIGDSRGYMFRACAPIRQTTDHSVSQLAVLRGEITPKQIRFHEARSKLLRALGSDESVEAEIDALGKTEAGDRFLLCSDGFWEYVTELEMRCDLYKSRCANEWLSYLLCRIGGRAPESRDNMSAIAIFTEE
jgi:serine/threonine protein phosphatase PrpC